LELEFAGHESNVAYAVALRERIDRSPDLRARVRVLGHVPPADLPPVLARWRAAWLLSEQENFGHAVITAAAEGVPTVCAPGVALAADLAAAGAGSVAAPDEAAGAMRLLLDQDSEAVGARCRAFAARFAWDRCAQELIVHLAAAAGL
jgi:teichuronic acid biosynthesis glycosyltransferase TuaC